MATKNSINIIGVNHVCLVVKDLVKSKHFYKDIIGMSQHPKVESWLKITDTTFLHLVDIPEAKVDDSLFHEIQHFAMQVSDLKIVQQRLFEFNQKPFQMDFKGNVKELQSAKDDLSFGIGTIFVPDPDGNLIEFMQVDKGIYSKTEA